jgi:hypothetical protein
MEFFIFAAAIGYMMMSVGRIVPNLMEYTMWERRTMLVCYLSICSFIFCIASSVSVMLHFFLIRQDTFQFMIMLSAFIMCSSIVLQITFYTVKRFKRNMLHRSGIDRIDLF